LQAQIEALYAQDRLARAGGRARPARAPRCHRAGRNRLIAKLADEEDRKLLALRARLPA
jgi:hypothetical protein